MFRDHGKNVYTIYSRTTRKGVRIVFHGHGIPDGLRDDRKAYVQWILSTPQERMLSVTPALVPEPEPAGIMKFVICMLCGEPVMESRVRDVDGKPVCIPCFVNHQST